MPYRKGKLEGSELTLAELQVLKLLAAGWTTAEIAEKLGKARPTVQMQSRFCLFASVPSTCLTPSLLPTASGSSTRGIFTRAPRLHRAGNGSHAVPSHARRRSYRPSDPGQRVLARVLRRDEAALSDLAFPVGRDDRDELVMSGIDPGHRVDLVLVGEGVTLVELGVMLRRDLSLAGTLRQPSVVEHWAPIVAPVLAVSWGFRLSGVESARRVPMHERLDGEPASSADVPAMPLDAGGRLRRRLDYLCASCGYQMRVEHLPPPCPMCRNARWEFAPWRPFTLVPGDYVARGRRKEETAKRHRNPLTLRPLKQERD